MFAAYTPTKYSRMKGSGVVKSLNWKALADSIHPNAATPLTSKESSRLLNALTGSFRRQLDEAHPIPIEGRPTSGRNGASKSKSSTSSMHSSAAFAQRHMASVLTNPLLVKGAERLDYGTAKVELQKNSAKDPISLLEEYDKKGAATVLVAELCLEKVKAEYDSLKPAARSKFLNDNQPGRRTLFWLLDRTRYDPSSFVGKIIFQDLLAFFLVREGREDRLWQWLRLDIVEEPPEKMTFVTLEKRQLYRYRWKGRLLRAWAMVKMGELDGPSYCPTSEDAHSIIDLYCAAVEMKRTAGESHHLRWTPLGGIGSYVANTLCNTKDRKWRPKYISVQKYEQFRDLALECQEGAPRVYHDVVLAKLDVRHPSRPSPDRAVNLFRELFSESRLPSKFLHRIREDGPSTPQRHVWYFIAAVTVYHLRNQGRTGEAEWLTQKIWEEFPTLAKHLSSDLANWTDGTYQYSMSPLPQSEATDNGDKPPARIPIPAFAKVHAGPPFS